MINLILLKSTSIVFEETIFYGISYLNLLKCAWACFKYILATLLATFLALIFSFSTSMTV